MKLPRKPLKVNEREKEIIEVANLRQKEIVRLKNILGFLESALQSRDETIKEYVNQVAELKNEAVKNSHVISRLRNENELLKTRLEAYQKGGGKPEPKQTDQFNKAKSMTAKQFNQNGLPIKTDTSPKHVPLANVETLKQFKLTHIPSARTVTESQGMQELKTLFLFPTGPKSVLVMDDEEIQQCKNAEDVQTLERLCEKDEEFSDFLENSSVAEKIRFCGIIKCLVSDFKNMLDLIARLRKLIKASHSISGSLNLNESFEKIVHETCDTLGCDRASVFLVDELNGELWTKIAKGANITIRIPLDKGIAGFVATTGKTLRIEEAYADPRFNKEVDKKNNYRTKTILCVPIKDMTGHVIGVCQAINKMTSTIFSMDDEGLLGLLASQAGIMLKNSMQYDKTVVNQNKLMRLIKIGIEMFDCHSIQEIVTRGQMYLKDLMNTEMATIVLHNHRKRMLFTYNEESIRKNFPLDIGIVGNTIKSGEVLEIKEPISSVLYNQNIDINSSLPILCMPIRCGVSPVSFGALQVSNMKNIFNTGGKSDFFEQEVLDNFTRIIASCVEKNFTMENSAISRVKKILVEVSKNIPGFGIDEKQIEKIVKDTMDEFMYDENLRSGDPKPKPPEEAFESKFPSSPDNTKKDKSPLENKKN